LHGGKRAKHLFGGGRGRAGRICPNVQNKILIFPNVYTFL